MTRKGAEQVLYHKGRKGRQQLRRDQGDEETAMQHTHTPTEHPNLKTSATTVGGELDWIGACLRVRMPLFSKTLDLDGRYGKQGGCERGGGVRGGGRETDDLAEICDKGSRLTQGTPRENRECRWI